MMIPGFGAQATKSRKRKKAGVTPAFSAKCRSDYFFGSSFFMSFLASSFLAVAFLSVFMAPLAALAALAAFIGAPPACEAACAFRATAPKAARISDARVLFMEFSFLGAGGYRCNASCPAAGHLPSVRPAGFATDTVRNVPDRLLSTQAITVWLTRVRVV